MALKGSQAAFHVGKKDVELQKLKKAKNKNCMKIIEILNSKTKINVSYTNIDSHLNDKFCKKYNNSIRKI
jgi:hypothetical protein